MTERKLKVALIGTGFGKTQMPAFRDSPDVEVVAVCSGQRARAEALAREFGVPAAYDDYRAMLAHQTLDIVSIVTPPSLHREMTLAAFAVGAHVLCEKPMAMSAAEAQAMCDAAGAAQRIGMIDHEFRYQPWRAYVKQLIDDGYIGRPYHFNATNFQEFRADPARPFSWWSQAESGGGQLGAIGSHYVDAVHTFLGPIAEVCGVLDARLETRPAAAAGCARAVTSDDNCAFLARLASGAVASVQLSSVTRPGGGEHIQIYGDHGSLLIDRHGKIWGGQGPEGHLQELPVPDKFQVDGPGLVGPFKVLLARMVEGIRAGATVVTPSFADGLAVQHVLDAIHASSAGGGWQKV
jgi:predicted dehydrogenase